MTHVACIIPRRQHPMPAIRLDLHRESSGHMLDWQAAIIAECRRHDTLNAQLVANLKRAGLLERCTFLASDTPGGPLRFRYIGCPTVTMLGRAWARQHLGRPHLENPHAEFVDLMSPLYAEAIEGDEAMHNLITMHGPWAEGRPYTHVLCGWQAQDGRRAVLSAIELQPRVH